MMNVQQAEIAGIINFLIAILILNYILSRIRFRRLELRFGREMGQFAGFIAAVLCVWLVLGILAYVPFLRSFLGLNWFPIFLRRFSSHHLIGSTTGFLLTTGLLVSVTLNLYPWLTKHIRYHFAQNENWRWLLALASFYLSAVALDFLLICFRLGDATSFFSSMLGNIFLGGIVVAIAYVAERHWQPQRFSAFMPYSLLQLVTLLLAGVLVGDLLQKGSVHLEALFYADFFRAAIATWLGVLIMISILAISVQTVLKILLDKNWDYRNFIHVIAQRISFFSKGLGFLPEKISWFNLRRNVALRSKRVSHFFQSRSSKILCPRASCGNLGRGISTPADDSRHLCAKCRQLLPRSNVRTPAPLTLALIGTSRCGKTSWLLHCIDKLIKTDASHSFPLDGQEAQWRAGCQALNLGKTLPPTQAVPGIAWCLDCKKDGRQQRVYIYDLSGLECEDPNRLARHRSFQHLDGLLLVVDPFGLPPVWSKYGAVVQTMRPPVEPAHRAFGEAHLAAVFRTLEMFRTRPRGAPWNLSVAVVVTKLDVIGLFRNFGDERHATEATIATACQKQLQEWGFENMMRALAFHFRRVSYFASYPAGKGAFSPDNALLWSFEVKVS